MPFTYTPKVILSEAEIYAKRNAEKRGPTIPPESRVSLGTAYAASAEQRKQEQPTPLKELAAQSMVEHPLDLTHLLPRNSKFRPTKEQIVNGTIADLREVE